MRTILRRTALCALALTWLAGLNAGATVPSAPQNLTPSWLWNYWPAQAQSLLWWEPVSDATSYTIYQYDETSSTWQVAVSGLNEPRYRNFLPPVPPTRYLVTASNSDGESAPSSEALMEGNMFNFSIIGDWPEYSSWSEAVTATNAWVSWYANNIGLGGVDGLLELSTNGTDFQVVMQNTDYGIGHGAQLTNLTPLSIYHYRVTTVGTNRGGLTLTRWFATEDTNHPPVAYAVDAWSYLGTPTSITLAGNDSAGSAPYVSIQNFRIIQGPTNGTLSETTIWAWNNSASVTYTPLANTRFEDHFWYVANDGELDSAPALVTITNFYNNQFPEAGYATYSTPEGVPVGIEFTGSDPDGDPLIIELVTNAPLAGTVSGPLTNLVYTPAPGYIGTDTVLYSVSDGSLTVLGAVIIEVTSTNVAPVAGNQSVSLPEETPVNITLTASDANGDTLIYLITESPAHGQVLGVPPNVTYWPGNFFNGPDQFSFMVIDGRGESSTGVVTLTVTPVNDAPETTDQFATIDEDKSLALSFLTGADADDDALTFRVISGPQHGQMVNGGTVYNPNPDYAGTDTLTFVANDGQLDSAPATLTITINNVNDPPLPNTPDATTLEDTPANIVLTAYNPDNDPLTFVLTGLAAAGTATLNGSNAVFTPASGASGPGSFDYAVSDGTYWATGRVVVNIISVEDLPEAYGQSAVTAEDTAVAIMLAGFDGDLDPITYSVVSGPSNGSLGGSGSSLMYTPNLNFNGTDSFAFKVNDGKADSAPATVNITISPVNDAPTLDAILNHGTAEDGPAIVKSLTGISSGAVNEAETITITAVSSNPALIPDPTVAYASPEATGSLAFRALTNANGVAIITVTVSDGTLATSRNFNVQISAVNDAPTIDPVAAVHIMEDAGMQTINLTGISGGPADESQALTVSIASTYEPVTGIPTLNYTSPNGTGTITFTPPANAHGLAVINVTLDDGAASTVLPVQIWIDSVNDAPVANGQSVSTAYNVPAGITLAASDVDGDTLSYSVLSGPANGTLSGTAPNLTFIPNLNWSGTTSFTFRVNDGSLDSGTATVAITVNGPTAVPAAPSGLTATAISRSRIDLAWTDNANTETGFKIERSANGTSWSQIATVGANVRNYSSTGLSANKTYYYRVRAYNALGNSPYSNTASAKTLR